MRKMIKKIDKKNADELLRRFQGTPGMTQGLSHNESLELFQYLIDSGEVYNMTDGTQYHVQAWAENGDLARFDESRMKTKLV